MNLPVALTWLMFLVSLLRHVLLGTWQCLLRCVRLAYMGFLVTSPKVPVLSCACARRDARLTTCAHWPLRVLRPGFDKGGSGTSERRPGQKPLDVSGPLRHVNTQR